jgi:Zn-dependent metalloprotease
MPKLHYHAAEDAETGPEATSRSAESFRGEGLESLGAEGAPAVAFNSDEAAARYYLDQILQREGIPGLESVIAPERPERVPGLVVESERDLPALGTHQVRFTQTQQDIPVFGASAVVELTDSRDLVSVSADLHDAPDVSPVETLSRAEALDRVAAYTGATIPREAGVSGRLNYFQDEDSGSWHLAWLLTALPAEPPAPGEEVAGGRVDAEGLGGHGMGPRPMSPRYNYLVDAHDGRILFCYSAVPTVLPTPARCTGIDENETEQTFFGQLASSAGTATELVDPLRAVKTYDLHFADLDTNPPVPSTPVQAATSDYGTTNRAAVSAHLNAARVQDFYKTVLQRDGIDDKGMDLISLVNVTYARQQPPPALLNAFWFDRRMWYGQINSNSRLVSLSRFLDVIGHELTHGVIETTSGLIYATQSGALNESFADVAGVIINNWYTAPDRHDVGTWTWEIGPGLRPNGGPLRNFADPSLTGHPQHMDDFRALPPGELPGRSNDNGWVHFNSNIHNKAVHNLLTLTSNGSRVFTVEDVAVLTYLGMARLAPRATFSAALQAVVDVAQTYFGGHPDRQGKIAAIREAYRLVGIG